MQVSRRILVVGEDATMLDRLGKHLCERQFDVRCAASASEALACYQEWPAELVISDYRLSDMHGLEMADAMRQVNARARFILITPPGETPEFMRATRSRIVAFLGKPFNPEDLMHYVHGAFHAGDTQFNRREHNRHPFSVEASLSLINPFDDSESRPIASLMRDVSRSGITMIVRQLLPVPAMLRISFNMRDQQVTYTMLAKSMSCTLTQIQGVYRLGAKFIGLLPRELEKTFVKMSRSALGDEDIFMGKSFKEAAREWLESHKADFAPVEGEYSQRLINEMANELCRNMGEEELGGGK